MTLHNSFMGIGPFKDGSRSGLVLDCLPPKMQLPIKHRRPEMFNKPVESYSHFVSLFLAEDGSMHIKSSQALRKYERYILEEGREKFQDILENYLQLPEKKRPRPVDQSSLALIPRGIQPHYAPKPVKRRQLGSLMSVEQPPVLTSQGREPTRQPPRGDKTVAIRVDDPEIQARWFGDAFKAVQQVACRTIAKVWIKKIHPKKQSTHPYNGQFPRHAEADPSRTRPPYWPQHVIHKEPDHIDRNARTALLVHLIMNTPQPQIKHVQDSRVEIFAQDLFTALEEKRMEFSDERWNMINEIIRVRHQIEMFSDGGYNPDTLIFAPDYSDSLRSSRSGHNADDDEDMVSTEPARVVAKEETDDDGPPTPESTRVSSPSPDESADAQESGESAPNPAPAHEGVESGEHGMELNNTNYHPSTHGLDVVRREQDSIGMAIDPRPFACDSKPPCQLRQPCYPGQDSMPFRNQGAPHQVQGLSLQPWLASDFSNDFGSTNLGLGGSQMLTDEDYQMEEILQDNGHAMVIDTAHGLPMLEDMTYQHFTTNHPRRLPVRSISTPRSSVLEQIQFHGLGLGHPSYHNGHNG